MNPKVMVRPRPEPEHARELAQLIGHLELQMGPKPPDWEREVIELPGSTWEKLTTLAALVLARGRRG
jgi:hypothetical protein